MLFRSQVELQQDYFRCYPPSRGCGMLLGSSGGAGSNSYLEIISDPKPVLTLKSRTVALTCGQFVQQFTAFLSPGQECNEQIDVAVKAGCTL